MPSRSDMDIPAVVTAVLLGVVLIAVSFPFLVADGGPSTRYTVAWTEAEVDSEEASFAGQGQTQEVTLTVPDALVSNVTVTMTCTDTPGTPARPATISWTLYEGDRELDSGSTPCTNDDEVARHNVSAHPDIGSIRGDSASDAAGKLYDRPGFRNETHTFRLEFSYDRPASPVPAPLPVGAPTLAGRMGLEAEVWRATVNEPAQEATR